MEYQKKQQIGNNKACNMHSLKASNMHTFKHSLKTLADKMYCHGVLVNEVCFVLSNRVKYCSFCISLLFGIDLESARIWQQINAWSIPRAKWIRYIKYSLSPRKRSKRYCNRLGTALLIIVSSRRSENECYGSHFYIYWFW